MLKKNTRMRLRLGVCVIFLFFALSAGFGNETPKKLILSFSRRTTGENLNESLEATAYYRAQPHLFCLETTVPLRQLVFFSPESTLIYYPNTQKAMRIEYRESQKLTMEMEILSVLLQDKGLEKNGYRIDRLENNSGTLTSVWLPPKESAKLIRDVRVVTDASDRILSMTTSGNAGKTIQITTYSGYGDEKASIPSEVYTRMFTPEGSVLLETTLTILSANTVADIPNRIASFTLPEGITVEVLK